MLGGEVNELSRLLPAAWYLFPLVLWWKFDVSFLLEWTKQHAKIVFHCLHRFGLVNAGLLFYVAFKKVHEEREIYIKVGVPYVVTCLS